MSLLQIAVIAVAFVIAGVAKGAIGMGMPPIAIGLMSFAVPLESAIAIMVVPTMVTNVWQAVYGGGFRVLIRRFGVMAIAAMIGIMAVGLFLSDLGSPRTAGWVGMLLVLYSLIALTPWRPHVSRRTERWVNPLIGLASGAVAGSTGVAAVPFLPYMQSLEMNQHELVQALGIMFLFITGMLAVSLAFHGECRRGRADHGRGVAGPARPPTAVASDVPQGLHFRHVRRRPASRPRVVIREEPCPCPTTS
jgi:hypothetical protein